MDSPEKKTNFTIGGDSRPPTPPSNTNNIDPVITVPELNSSAIPGVNFYQDIPKQVDRFTSIPISNSSLTLASRNSSGDCLLPYQVKNGRLGKSFQKGVISGGTFEVSIGPENRLDSNILPSDDSGSGDSMLWTGLQVCIALALAGFGNVGAGLILDQVQHWSVFKAITELFILVPSLLGLKGNLEMTMAARLSTQANLGNMREWKTTFKMVKGNIVLIQCQATVVAFLASIIAIVANILKHNSFNLNNTLILCASSLITANVACFILGSCTVVVIVFSHRFEIDPDNVATPIAASLGDVTTLSLLAAFAQMIHNHTFPDAFPTLCVIIIVVFLALLPLWFYYSFKNEYSSSVVTSGWTPVIVAMLISSMGGFILDHAAGQFDKIAMFQPLVNGVGGNIVAVQASRFSTYLHRLGKPGHIPAGVKTFISPCKAFFGTDVNTSTARILLLMAIPAHILYILVIKIIKGPEQFEITTAFLFFYMIFALLQVMLLLYLDHNLIMILWKNAIDPDNFSIPILTALGDFLGSAFLLFAFIILSLIKDPNVIKKY